MVLSSVRFMRQQRFCRCRKRYKNAHHNTYSTEAALITPLDEAKRFMVDCFVAVKTSQDNAQIIADNLVEADFRGHYSHGMNRLDMYIRDIQHGTTDPNAKPEIEKQTAATVLVNGHNGMGAVVGKKCMEFAIDKARETGVGVVVAHSSNHYGIAGIYAQQAIKVGLIGMSFTNTSPLMTPTRAKQATLGTNPMALGAPALNGDYFLLDMATTGAALGKIELAKRKQQPLPIGWALNDEGKPETNAEIAYNAMQLMPLGGTELNSGYKGYGLSMLVEVLCGMLSGSAYGPNIRKWGKSDKIANLGQCFIAIDPKVFAPGFEQRMTDLMGYIRKLSPVDPKLPVLVHGDPERNHMNKVCQEGGLRYVENQHKTNAKLADQLKITPMVSKSC
ncbi:uncharacterized oxidoreductase YjmC-like [Cylas formicarius]|uniref:uncharacterized oxidoreductase YjmC-like n=1 Tax=Cylas formicarius TaxID=197179 RepID=UPI002958320D|nr:uncharacterized oxidoreductase YjmC-like [Cylas formicarius]